MNLTAKQKQEIEAAIAAIQAIGRSKMRDIDKATERAQFIREISVILGYNPLKTSEESWNSTLVYLDSNYPGWRGYTVRYPSGRAA